MPRPALSDRYVVAPAAPGRAALAFRSLDKHTPGSFLIGSVGEPCGMDRDPRLRLACPMERLPDLT